MKANWKVETQAFGGSDNAILVHNFCALNEIWITPFRMKSIAGFCKDNLTGVWKIKSLKS
jgi:hypothetical protein